MSPDEYDQAVADIVNFLEYTGEPAKLESHKIGKVGAYLYRSIVRICLLIEERILARSALIAQIYV